MEFDKFLQVILVIQCSDGVMHGTCHSFVVKHDTEEKRPDFD